MGLRGRATVVLRPLPMFDRANVLLLDGGTYRTVVKYVVDPPGYTCSPAATVAAERMASLVIRVRSPLCVRREALGGVNFEGGNAATHVRCVLAMPEEADEQTPADQWRHVRVALPLAGGVGGRERSFLVRPEDLRAAADGDAHVRVV